MTSALRPFTENSRRQYTKDRYDLNNVEAEYPEEGGSTFSQIVGTYSDHPADFAYQLIGIPEDIGVRANMGRYGARKAWDDFLKAFLSLQHHDLNQGSRFQILGEIDCADLTEQGTNLNSTIHTERLKLSRLTEQVDRRVYSVLEALQDVSATKIIIGGGHNNCFPILKALSNSKPISCFNLDAHTDFRPAKGRHSGNGFTHALEKGYMSSYVALGINESFMSTGMLKRFKTDSRLTYHSYTADVTAINKQVEASVRFMIAQRYGIEIDLDVIADFPTSARSPVGYSLQQVIHIVCSVITQMSKKPVYIHICEGAPRFGYELQVGKAIAQIVRSLP